MNDASSSRQKMTASELKPIDGLPLLLEVETNGLSAVDWAEKYKHDIQNLIKTNGAALIRGLKVLGSAQFGKILSTLFGDDLLEYVYRSTPRTELRGNVYTATEYPAGEVIPQHNENSYSRNWPNRIGFMCLIVPETGGETPIGDSRLEYNIRTASVIEKVETKGR